MAMILGAILGEAMMLMLALVLAASAQAAGPPPAPPAEPRPTSWPWGLFSADDYPAAALRAEEQGRVTYRLTIGPDGRVSDCAIRGTSGSAALDAATCRILTRRARFIPARDPAGIPVPDSREGRIDWVIPRQAGPE